VGAAHLTPEQRAGATVYTSGEHCAMCAAAHGWVGLGRIVYASSSAQLGAVADGGGRALPVLPLPVSVARVVVAGAVETSPTRAACSWSHRRETAVGAGFDRRAGGPRSLDVRATRRTVRSLRRRAAEARARRSRRAALPSGSLVSRCAAGVVVQPWSSMCRPSRRRRVRWPSWRSWWQLVHSGTRSGRRVILPRHRGWRGGGRCGCGSSRRRRRWVPSGRAALVVLGGWACGGWCWRRRGCRGVEQDGVELAVAAEAVQRLGGQCGGAAVGQDELGGQGAEAALDGVEGGDDREVGWWGFAGSGVAGVGEQVAQRSRGRRRPMGSRPYGGVGAAVGMAMVRRLEPTARAAGGAGCRTSASALVPVSSGSSTCASASDADGVLRVRWCRWCRWCRSVSAAWASPAVRPSCSAAVRRASAAVGAGVGEALVDEGGQVQSGVGVEQAAQVDVAVGEDPQVQVVRVGRVLVGAVGLQRVEQQPQCGAELRSGRRSASSTNAGSTRAAGSAATSLRRTPSAPPRRRRAAPARPRRRGGSSGVPPVCSRSSAPDAVLDDRGEKRLVEIGGGRAPTRCTGRSWCAGRCGRRPGPAGRCGRSARRRARVSCPSSPPGWRRSHVRGAAGGRPGRTAPGGPGRAARSGPAARSLSTHARTVPEPVERARAGSSTGSRPAAPHACAAVPHLRSCVRTYADQVTDWVVHARRAPTGRRCLDGHYDPLDRPQVQGASSSVSRRP
jgi:hypothetical protein